VKKNGKTVLSIDVGASFTRYGIFTKGASQGAADATDPRLRTCDAFYERLTGRLPLRAQVISLARRPVEDGTVDFTNLGLSSVPAKCWRGLKFPPAFRRGHEQRRQCGARPEPAPPEQMCSTTARPAVDDYDGCRDHARTGAGVPSSRKVGRRVSNSVTIRPGLQQAIRGHLDEGALRHPEHEHYVSVWGWKHLAGLLHG